MTNFLQNIFSVINTEDLHKQISIFGCKFKFRRNKELESVREELNDMRDSLNDIKNKITSINRDLVVAFQYETGIELNNNFTKEREIVFDPKDVPVDHYNRYSFATENVLESDIVADVACTCGYGSYMLSKKAKEVIGVDINQPVINFANKVYASDRIKFLCQNAQNLDLPKKLDAVVSFETIEHIPHPELFLKKVYSFLNDNGKLICSVPNEITRPWAKENNEFHYRHYTKESLIKLLNECGFEVEKIYQQYHDNNYIIEQRADEGDMLIAVANKK